MAFLAVVHSLLPSDQETDIAGLPQILLTGTENQAHMYVCTPWNK